MRWLWNWISNKRGTIKWIGGVLAPNGKVYGIPYNATVVLIIDPVTDTADTTTITGLTGSNKWLGGILAPNGKIYGIPYNSTVVLIIDPATDTADTTSITGLSDNIKWIGTLDSLDEFKKYIIDYGEVKCNQKFLKYYSNKNTKEIERLSIINEKNNKLY